ncbi:MAG TPA: SDR family NAD(P)-dependent oxidoreductase [Lacunisphaera sp.]|nr:SDR family NAD(P)-dependent oxidoreductase [Lacunisphaera sp.]
MEKAGIPRADKWAVVTGASGGIGREIARQLGRRGYHLVVVARTADRLEALRAELASGNRDVRAVALDLADPDAATELVALTDRWGIVPEVLVNNAGFAAWGPFLESPPDVVAGMLQLNVGTLVQLSQLYGRRMRERGGGYLLHVASTAAFQPVPSFAVYAATKGLVMQFSRALHAEGRRSGVSSTVLCPGPTDTAFFARAQLVPNRFFRALMMSPEEVARQGLAALFRRRAVHVPGWLNKLGAFVPRVVPSGWMPRLAYLCCKGDPVPAPRVAKK